MARAAIADMIARQCGRVYAAPVYNTVIARQYNCSVGATATGNQSVIANSPTVTGAAAPSTGNADQRGGERCQPRRQGTAITQGCALMVDSALGKLGGPISLAERFDPSVSERELAYLDRRQLGDGKALPSRGHRAMPAWHGALLWRQPCCLGLLHCRRDHRARL